MGRILVIRGGALGDFILTLPVLAALKEQFPQARLDLLAYPQFAALATAAGLADGVEAIEARPLAGFFARNGALDARVAAYFESFAVIISYLYDPDGIFRENVGRCSRAQFIVGPHRPNEHGELHAIDTFVEPLQRLAIFAAGAAPRLALPAAKPGPGTWVGVHPGSGSESKNWPEAHWRDVLRRMVAETAWQLLLVGGEAEGPRLEGLAAALPPARVRLARSRPLPELAGLLRGCAQFVGHDSGVTHMAAALGVPSLVLWGPSRAAVWRPRGDHVAVLHDPAGLVALTPDRVWSQLRGSLETRASILPGVPG